MAAEGEFPKVDGDVLYGGEVNVMNNPTIQLYTGSAIDASNTSTNAAWAREVLSTELANVTAAQVNGKNYLRVNYTGVMWDSYVGPDTNIDLNIYIKELGGAYVLIKKFEPAPGGHVATTGNFLYALTNDMITLGFKIKLETDNVYTGGQGQQNVYFTNEQISIELI